MALGSAEDFDDLDELVDAAFSREDWLAEHELCNDATYSPHVYLCCVLGIAEDKLRSPVVSRANVGNVGFIRYQLFG